MVAAKALEYGGRFLRRAVADAEDVEARGAMMLAASMAGVGFGSAGVHIPHACAYPIAGLKHGDPTTSVRPARDLRDRDRAGRVRVDLRGRPGAPRPRGAAARRNVAAETLRALMEDLGVPTGLRELGYTEDDIPALVEGALAQQRLLVGSPREVGEGDLAAILRASLESPPRGGRRRTCVK